MIRVTRWGVAQVETGRAENFNVSVETDFVDQQSDSVEDRFVFAYTITIANSSSAPARLLNRHWIVTDGNGVRREVQGEGVVGQQPNIEPGKAFRYTSGVALETEIGSMYGTYEFVSDGGERFDVPIPTFTLSVPNFLH